MDRLEYQVQQEETYGRWAEKAPKLAETWKTYIQWQNAGRQVIRGAASKQVKVAVCVGVYQDIDGEDVPRMGWRYASVFNVDQTEVSTKRYARAK